ncbi:gas vesicle protein GvpO [Anaerosacchariphilus polymeriproducens]|nr:gas vesicle protein GvpO [Anaerosacchariphilus polymeriproducens]
MKRVIEAARIFFEDLYENTATVVGVKRCEDNWELLVEVITDDDYTRKRAKNDLISVFKVNMDSDLQIISYSREEIRERGKALEKTIY